MYQYETVVIFTPVLSDDEIKRTTESYKDNLKTNGGELVHEEIWGLRQLAYPINKKTTGIYFVFEFKGNADSIGKLELQFSRDETVLRYHTIALDKHSIDYNQRKYRGEIGKGRKTEPKPKAAKKA